MNATDRCIRIDLDTCRSSAQSSYVSHLLFVYPMSRRLSGFRCSQGAFRTAVVFHVDRRRTHGAENSACLKWLLFGAELSDVVVGSGDHRVALPPKESEVG